MRIKLLAEWMNNNPGIELNIIDSKAKELIARGCAISLESIPEKEPLFEKKEEAVIEKEVENPVKHRMVIKERINTK